MNWSTGNWSSVPTDQRAFLEKDSDAHWWVYETDEDGDLLEGFPKLHPHFFYDSASAQVWVEMNVPPREEDGLTAHTIKRLREERDRLRNEVVALRGHVGHDYLPDLETDLGDTLQFHCERCGKVSTAPVHGYFDPCSGRRP